MFCLYVCVCPTYMNCPQRPQESVGSPGTEVMNGHEP